eukprot:TRINITY_DN574_c0_g2_i1.p1 TRINITY_DN574_c0_g2~~TRINITY_DN574_c0_g2_i1.p1  ORF type:complete len:2184 (+),score=918.74 TRINITY_DN574_c0_g2_i1:142-6693(+)
MAEAGVADMINIRDLTEDSLLENLEIRYHKNLIYTYTGSILVAMNPYQLLPLYSMNIVKQYVGKRMGLMPPHVFATADDSFRSMSDDSKNQSIIISGESGAGKTETTKLILQFLSARTSSNARTSVVEKKILESSPILEAFGNAKTVRNNNSSRFGKYMEIHFDATDTIVSARIVQYLLEKSRIVQQAESERNYHVFYQLLKAPQDVLQKLFLTVAEDYSYLNTSGCISIDNVDDRDDFERMVSAMTTIGFTPVEQHSIFECISAVLHIGNLKFKLLTAGKGEASDVANPEVITTISQLLKCDPDTLSKSIRQRINFIRGEKFVVPLSQSEASDNRDALAKTIYSTLFAWLVDKINYCILEGQAVKKKKAFIGVLDIFGFENFKINSFEQLCINFTNEKLQQHFNQHIFKLEQEEYKREQIAWANIAFVDNQECIDLIEKKPIGIISLLDEECRFPKGTDITWLEKMHTNYAKHANYEKPRTSKNTFIIKHYAGDVSYTVTNFLEKNKDTLQEELMDLLTNSGSEFIANLFAEYKAEKERAKKEAESGGTMKKQTNKATAATKFKEQLLALVATLTSTSPHYVRCLKPNATKSPNEWDSELVMAQLRYAGMMETIRIRKLGYPIRFNFKDFTDRYRVLTNGLVNAEPRQQVQQIIDASKIPAALIQLGLTKVFMKDGQRGVLEDLRNVAVTKCIIKMQKTYKMYRAKKKYQKIKKATKLGQKLIRRYLARVHYLKLKESTLLAQSLTRMRKARKAYLKQRESIVLAQSLWRRKKAMALLVKLKEEKRKREEAERKERERLAAERAHLAQQEREALEAQDRENERLAKEAEKQAARAETETQNKLANDKKQKQDQEKAAAEKEKQEKETDENLKNLGIYDDLNDLARVLTTSKSSANLNISAIPPPPPPSFGDDSAPSKPKDALDLTQIDDMDLLDAMMSEDFFGDIPSFVPNSLDQLAGDYVNASALPSFDFLATASLGAPPPPQLDDLDLPPPPPPMDDMMDLPPPPPVSFDSSDLPASISGLPPPPGALPPPPSSTAAAKPKAPVVDNREKVRERPTGVDRVTPKLITPPTEPPKIIIPEEIENYLFKTFALKNFREPKKKSKKPSELYTWTKKSVEGGSVLKNLTGEDLKNAEQIFGKVQGYMGDNKKTAGDGPTLVKFIISKGITNKSLRDEIFCQICKQTNDNPDRESKKKGWELLAYCTSFFPCSDEFAPYLASYILAELQLREGERDIAGYCIRALRRTIQNGSKKVPPCTAEMEAIDKRAPAPVRVRFMDGTDLVLLADSATTAGEMIASIINTLKIRETQGFGLFEVYNNMARRLGQSDHLLDAIAKSENLQKQMVSRNLKISFNLLFKKSVFVDDKWFYEDLVARDLVFSQLSHDLVEGGFPISIEAATRLAALKQVADSKNGRSFDYKKVVPIPLLPSRTDEVWRALIEKEHITVKKLNPDEAIDEWLQLASKQPLFGSTLFNDVNVKDSKDSAHYDVVVNRKGIQTLTKNTTEVKAQYPIAEIRNWNCQDSPNVLTVTTANGQVVFTKEGEAFRMAAILKEYVDALQGVGWAVTNTDFPSSDAELLSFKKGDIIFVKRKDQNGWYIAEMGETVGSIQEDHFDILVGNPTETGAIILAGPAKRKELAPPVPPPVSIPSQDSGATLRGSMAPDSGATLSPRGSLNVGSGETLRDVNMSTLRDLGMETISSSSTIRFRQTKRRTVKAGEDPMAKMKWQKEPLSNSLLELPSSLNKEAKECFTLIMKFMGDAPNKLGDKVVGDLIQFGCDQEELRDEIYAQVVKQSTNNPRRESNLKGWELLSMVCGSFLPTPDIQPMIVQHIANPPHDSNSERWSALCVEAMKNVREKGNRKRGPIPEEVTAILNGTQLVPRYFSMDGTRKAFKVSSHTTVREVNVELCGKYDISVYSGFGLCEHNSEADTITPLPEDSYICDYYNLWTASGKMDTIHKFLFKRRVLTVDPTADMGLTTQNPTVFAVLFHETLYEFKNGRILVQTDDLPALIALQLQIREGDKASEITKQGIAPLLPKHLQTMQLTDEFISKVGVQRFEFKNLTPADCKLYIMRILTTKDLYGACIFPMINVKSPKVSYNKVWIVITRKTVAIHEPHDREPKQTFAYDYITRAFVEEGNLTVVVGSLMRDEKWILSGPDVTRIEDLIRLCKQVESKNTFVPSGW